LAKSRIDKSFWNNSWSKLSFERYYGIEKYLALSSRMGGLFKRFLKKGDSSILEIGCARAKQLIYFAKEFGYRVWGIELSEPGAELARKNLSLAGVKGTILCEDMLNTSLPEESFDVVYSMGLVEHFDNPEEAIDAHSKLLKNGGTMIITVPNFRNSIYLSGCRLFGVRDWILKMHNLDTMDRGWWLEVMERKGLEIVYLDYFGNLDFSLSFGLFTLKPILYVMLALNQVIGYATYFMVSSRYLSPYLVIIARKG
jgi:SAM-dependent methyltransferase